MLRFSLRLARSASSSWGCARQASKPAARVGRVPHTLPRKPCYTRPEDNHSDRGGWEHDRIKPAALTQRLQFRFAQHLQSLEQSNRAGCRSPTWSRCCIRDGLAAPKTSMTWHARRIHSSSCVPNTASGSPGNSRNGAGYHPGHPLAVYVCRHRSFRACQQRPASCDASVGMLYPPPTCEASTHNRPLHGASQASTHARRQPPS